MISAIEYDHDYLTLCLLWAAQSDSLYVLWDVVYKAACLWPKGRELSVSQARCRLHRLLVESPLSLC